MQCFLRARQRVQWTRSFASASSTATAERSIYVSQSSDPYFNLTLEDWLFRHGRQESPLLLVYRDSPCVVIGRNQNPWKEVNFTALRGAGVPFIRRRSGGGTVYHDLGNTNFSIHLPRTQFDRFETAKIALRAVSGSAYKIVNKRAYHHGTMLISTQLDTLGDLIRVNKDSMITKGVASVRSPVCNLQQSQPDASHERFTQAMIEAFSAEYGINEQPCLVCPNVDEYKSIPYIQDGIAELPTWEWAYGQTPEFTYTIDQAFSWGHVEVEIRAKHGIMLDCNMRLQDSSLAEDATSEIHSLAKSLEGKRYSFVDVADVAEATHQTTRDVRDWLLDVALRA